MTNVTKAEYELQRRMNLLLAQAPPASDRDRATIEQLAKVEAAHAASAPSSPSTGGSLMGSETTGLEVEVELRMIQVPTSMVHLLDDRTPLLTYKIKNTRSKKARLKLVSCVVGYSAEAIDTIEVDARAEVELPHFPVFEHDRIALLSETRAACLRTRVEDLDGSVERENTYRVVLLPRTSSYLSVQDAAGKPIDLTPYLGAWVTPNVPEIMQLIRMAASFHPDRAIVGYQPADAPNLGDIATRQVAAIFAALKAQEVVYVNSVAAFNLAGGVFVQRIRLPRESLAARSANCIDGVVLMASALEAASLNPAIVLIPGHAFLAFELAPDSGRWDFVETTMIATSTFEQAQQVGRRTAAQL
ncbi:MAG TPA: hypothetical protein VFT22_43560, partial [Kofleriaceae bacterium]|nr:hypothetical protein [Kofleriaceae bacterium]